MPRKTVANEPIQLYRSQNFVEIRDWCLKRNIYFEDPFFKLIPSFEWRRPWEIVSKPQLFVDGPSRFDVLQGDLGNCWMLAAIANLAMHPDLVKRVIPTDQSFKNNYAGIFHFRFWQFGKWYDVVVDDRLPTVDGKLVFTHSSTPNEFWSALFEKAYCKLLGDSYSVAESGNLCEALEDFTGGVVEQFFLQCIPHNFLKIFLNSLERSSLIGCFIDDLPGKTETKTPEGLLRGHSYSITAAKTVKLSNVGEIVLVRLRNPWGKYEWAGAWSDKSSEWKSVTETTKTKLGLVNQDDGEFWMSFNDFLANFHWVDMCHVSAEALKKVGKKSSTWHLNTFRGNWVEGVNAGGAKFLHNNPQMRFVLKGADARNSEGQCSVLIALTQKTTGKRLDEYLEIGFKVYRLIDRKYENIPLDKHFILKSRSAAHVPLKRVREVTGRFSLNIGNYCVIPFTYEAEQAGEFLLRIFSEKKTEANQVVAKVTVTEVDMDIFETPVMTMSIEEGKEVDNSLKENFDKISKGTKVLDWKGLKELLALAIKNYRPSTLVRSSGIGGFFKDVAAYMYNQLVVTEGTGAFETIGPDGFSDHVCRSLIALVDSNHYGIIDFDQFQRLWRDLKAWKLLYEQHSGESEGCLQSGNVRPALQAAGFQLNDRILTDIVHRYASEDGKLSLDGFLDCGLKIKNMSDRFRTKDPNNSGRATFTLEEFLEKTLYT